MEVLEVGIIPERFNASEWSGVIRCRPSFVLPAEDHNQSNLIVISRPYTHHCQSKLKIVVGDIIRVQPNDSTIIHYYVICPTCGSIIRLGNLDPRIAAEVTKQGKIKDRPVIGQDQDGKSEPKYEIELIGE